MSHKSLSPENEHILDPSSSAVTWELCEELGGEDALRALITLFYDRLYEDAMVGFFFIPHDKSRLIAHQISYVLSTLGKTRRAYEGKPMRAAHQNLPILSAHFDRRHQILKDVMDEYKVPDHVRCAWLELDLKLKPLIVRTGTQRRSTILNQ